MLEPGRWRIVLAIFGLLALGTCSTTATEPRTIAVFDLELVDTSLQGETEGIDPADLARLRMIESDLVARLEASGSYRVVDTRPVRAEIKRAGQLYTCRGCEVAIARRLDADLALVGWVQKVSNLILNINLTIRDVATGELVFAGGVDIRGNTDESWRHGMRYLLTHQLFGE